MDLAVGAKKPFDLRLDRAHAGLFANDPVSRAELTNQFLGQIPHGNIVAAGDIYFFTDALVRFGELNESVNCIFHISKISKGCQTAKFDSLAPERS